MSKLRHTSLTEKEFLAIPPEIVLKIFDVAFIYNRLPQIYRDKKDFKEELICSGHWFTYPEYSASVGEQRCGECKICAQNLLTGFHRV